MQLQMDLNKREVCGACCFNPPPMNKSITPQRTCINTSSPRFGQHLYNLDVACEEWSDKDVELQPS